MGQTAALKSHQPISISISTTLYTHAQRIILPAASLGPSALMRCKHPATENPLDCSPNRQRRVYYHATDLSGRIITPFTMGCLFLPPISLKRECLSFYLNALFSSCYSCNKQFCTVHNKERDLGLISHFTAPEKAMAGQHRQTRSNSSTHSVSSSNVVGVHYKVGRKIGEGSFGIIYEGKCWPLSCVSRIRSFKPSDQVSIS